MHPERLTYLARNNAPRQNIEERNRNKEGHWEFKLICGHTAGCVSHFDCSKTETWDCVKCGEEHVKTSSRWADEFK